MQIELYIAVALLVVSVALLVIGWNMDRLYARSEAYDSPAITVFLIGLFLLPIDLALWVVYGVLSLIRWWHA